MPLVTADELALTLGYPTPTGDPTIIEVANAADQWTTYYLTPTDTAGDPIDHTQHDYCRRAALEVAVNMMQSASAAGGQPVAADFTPAPYQMGASLLRRISGIVGPCRDVMGMVG